MNSDRAAPTAEGIRSGWPGLSGAPAYLLALAVTSVAVVLRQLADPWLGDNFPLVMTFGAVAIAVWFGGYRPAILSAAVGYLACDILFVEPRGAFADRPVAMLIGIVAYIVSCGLIIAIGEGLRRTRKRLTADQATLAGVLASIDDNFAMVDRDWRYVYVNDRMVEVARRSREDLIGTLSWEIYPGLLGTPYEAAARRSMATQRPERITFYYPPRDRWFDTLFYPTAAGMSMLAADVTDQKRAESSLAQRVGELRTLYEFADRLQRTTSVAEVFEPAFDAMRDALGAGRASILLFDANNRMRFVASRGLSEAYRQAVDGHTPWTPRDTDATPIWVEHAAAADVEEWLRERLAAEGIAALAFVPLIAGGRLIGKFMLYYGEPRPAVQEKIELSQLIARQLALAIERHRVAEERQRALEALTASEERFRLATEAGSVGVWDWDIERNRVAWSDSLLCIHGISPEGFEGTIEFFSSLVHPDDRDRVAKAIDDALADRARYELEFRIRRPDGTVCWVYADAAVLRRDGRPYRMIGATVDITRRKESEEALRDANERKDEFLSTLAHELRNPLAPIVSTLDILQRAGDDAAIRARSGAVLERQVQHLVRLVDDLFDVARINHNRLALRRERVDLAEVLRQAVDGARPLVDALGHTLTVSIARVGMPLLADPVRLAQVFGNLLNNACKYTPTGGRIELAATVDDGHAVVRVRDSGAGIPGEMLSRIFESFVQLERSLERSHGGLGIGLTLVKRLVEMHGGSVSAASDGPDRGSEFVVRLPLLHAAADAKAVRNSVAPAVRARRILVVDDNRDGAESLAAVLRLSGHETALAHDGMEALAVGAAFRPELILLDIGLPRLDGFETCRAIRDSGWGADVNVVALTGWGQEAHRRRSEEAGFDAHLVKPVDHAALANLIADMAPGGSVEVREA